MDENELGDVEYKFIVGKDADDFSYQVQDLLRRGFHFRTEPYTQDDKIYGELVKVPRVQTHMVPYHHIGQTVPLPVGIPSGPVLHPNPAIPAGSLDFFSGLINPEGRELLTRLAKAYNNPEFRKHLEEVVGDFVPKEQNTAMTDEELRRLADME